MAVSTAPSCFLLHFMPPKPLILHTYTLHLSPFSPLISVHISHNPRYRLHSPSTPIHFHGVSRYNPPKKLNFRAHASAADDSQNAPSNARLVLVCSAVTVILAVANRVFYKLALVPLKQYPFFLAQFTTFG